MAAPELRLAVGLDLEFFRGQMRKAVNIAQSEFTAQLNVKINRTVLDRELNHVSRMFARRDFRLQVNDTSIKTARLNAQKLKNTLDLIAKTRYAINLQGGGPGGGFAQSGAGAAGLMEYMRTQGLSGGGGFAGVGRSTRLQKALEDLTVKQLQSLARQEGISGASKLRKTPLIDKLMTDLSQTAMERILGNTKMMLQNAFPYVATTGVSGRTLAARVTGQMPMGGGLPMLPAAGQTAAFSMGTMPSNLRQPSMPSAGMMGPATQLPGGYHSVNKLISSLREADQFLQRSRVPLTGAIAELGSQFGNAIKQVLLFGTAYKALAFVIDIPKQAFDAAKSLQLFENQIRVLTGSAAEADRAFGFIDDLVARFNIPLQSARQGFAQLYASMSPAGIPIGEVENLFEGMSTAAATLGMSSAEMDRMTLAFSQMASKGKIMTEEVTRQLGDVLPGALAKMAKAAQMEIPAFIDAMQKGQLSGKAMQDVLFNMGILMQTDFGEGASNAAKLLQGAMNSIGNSVQRMYEAFRPVVEDLAAQAMPALAQVIQDITKGVQAFASSFSGANTPVSQLNTTAQNVFNTLKGLQEIFKAIKAVIDGIAPAFGLLGQIIFSTAEQISRFINTPFGGALTNWLTTTLTLTAALVAFVKIGILGAGAAIIRLIQQIQLLIAKKITLAAVTTSVKLGLIGLAGAAVIGAIVALSNALQGPANRLREMEQRIAKVKKGFDDLAAAGDVATLTAEVTLVKTEETRLKQQITTLQKQLQLPLIGGGSERAGLQASLTAAEEQYAEALEKRRAAEISLRNATKVAAPVLPDLRKVTLEGGDEQAAKAAKIKAERESQIPLLQLRLKKTREIFAIDQQIISAQLAGDEILTSSLELQRKLTELKYQGKEIALENIPVEEQRLKLQELEFQYQTAILESRLQLQLEAQKARESIQQDIEKNLQGYQEENQYQQRYVDLIRNGISPAIAKIRVEVEKTFATEKKRIDVLVDQYEANKASLQIQIMELEASKDLSKADKMRLDDLKERIKLIDDFLKKLGLLEGGLPGAQSQAIDLATQGAESLPLDVRYRELVDEAKKSLDELNDPLNQLESVARGVADAIGEAFKGLVLGTTSLREALANTFAAIAERFADMVAQMITEWLFFQLITGIGNLFGLGARGANMGGSGYFNPQTGLGTAGPNFGLANGGILGGPFIPITPFANGGIIKGPTLGLVGEGRYNEAVIPLPDGKSVPVDLGGAMGGQAVNNIVVNVDAKGSKVEGDEQEGKQLGRVIAAAIQQELVKQKRPGGLLA
jgi:tape measure domain-containing protein